MGVPQGCQLNDCNPPPWHCVSCVLSPHLVLFLAAKPQGAKGLVLLSLWPPLLPSRKLLYTYNSNCCTRHWSHNIHILRTPGHKNHLYTGYAPSDLIHISNLGFPNLSSLDFLVRQHLPCFPISITCNSCPSTGLGQNGAITASFFKNLHIFTNQTLSFLPSRTFVKILQDFSLSHGFHMGLHHCHLLWGNCEPRLYHPGPVYLFSTHYPITQMACYTCFYWYLPF
jgi:hypothetical protein